ncbi:MAG: response regulator transcription factor [Anaerolineales bacterium]|nr:response regulator transcription factor [Anaerolineales bacterium]
MSATPIRVLLVDDQPLFREGLHTLLTLHADIAVVGEANDGQEALEQVAALTPDVVLMDVRMPRLDGVAATRILHREHPAVRILMLTTFDDDEYVFEGLRAGAVGYLLKDVSSGKLVEAIRAAAGGQTFLQPSVATKVVAELTRLISSEGSAEGETAVSPLLDPLSDRELEILQVLAAGASNREIASRLYITEGTVKNHVSSILSKLGVRDRTQAALRARELGLI